MVLNKSDRLENGAYIYNWSSRDRITLDKLSIRQAKQLISQTISNLNNNDEINYAMPKGRVSLLLIPNDSRFEEEWHYYDPNGGINLPDAWDLITGKGIVIGVVDSGITDNKNLRANILPGHNFVDDGAEPDDPKDRGGWYHGTHVAGTIAAEGNKNHTVAGIAWDAKVVPVKVTGAAVEAVPVR